MPTPNSKLGAWILLVIGLPLLAGGGWVFLQFLLPPRPDDFAAMAVLTAFIWIPALLALVAGALLVSFGVVALRRASRRPDA